MDLIFGNHKKLLKFKMAFMPQYKTAFDHIQDKTATAVGSNSYFLIWIAFSESVVIRGILSR